MKPALFALVPVLFLSAVYSGAQVPAPTAGAPPLAAYPEEEGAGRSEGRLDDIVLVALVFVRDAEASRFSDSLAAALLGELAARGIPARLALLSAGLEPGAAEAKSGARFARSEGASTLALVDAWIEGSRVFWRTAIYDARDGALLGGDAWSAFAGLSSLKLIEDSAAQAAQDLSLSRQAGTPSLRLSSPLVFRSPDEGLRVSLGGGNAGASLPLGSIEAGRLEAPYLPLRIGESATFTAELEGFYDSTFSVRPRDEGKPIRIPRLVPETRKALVLSSGRGRLYGLGVEYRPFLIPDFTFLRLDGAYWKRAAYGLSGAPWSLELRAGAGVYLFFPPSSAFRFAAASGLAGMLTKAPGDGIVYKDLVLDAADLLFEYHFGHFAVTMETRIAYSFGVSSGFLRQAWLMDNGPSVLLGALWKW